MHRAGEPNQFQSLYDAQLRFLIHLQYHNFGIFQMDDLVGNRYFPSCGFRGVVTIREQPADRLEIEGFKSRRTFEV